MDDEDGEDDHKMHKLIQAAIKEQLLTVEIRGEYVWEGRLHEVIFEKAMKGLPVPEHLLIPLQFAYQETRQIGLFWHGGGLPSSCTWTAEDLPREKIEISVLKSGEGVRLRYALKDSKALDMENLPGQIHAELINGWAVGFGTSTDPKDGELTERLHWITA
jgi:hypothetical protein